MPQGRGPTRRLESETRSDDSWRGVVVPGYGFGVGDKRRDSAVLGRKRAKKRSKGGGSTDADIAAQLATAEELARQGKVDAARALLKTIYDALPDERLSDLLPAPTRDLTSAEEGRSFHARALEQLARLPGPDGRPDPSCVAELARLQPLVPLRLGALADAAAPGLGDRARTALRALLSGGLAHSPENEGTPKDPRRPLAERLVSESLRHPLARKGTVLGKMQAMLAAIDAPDLSMLRDYCEPLQTGSSDASGAVAQAAFVLGTPAVSGYVSRGAKGVGVRAYAGDPAFVLVGGRHLEADGTYTLTPRELLFAIGSEVAHLRYEHARVTSREVRQGAWDMSKQGIDMMLGILPVIQGLKAAPVASRFARRIPVTKLRAALHGLAHLRAGVQRTVEIAPEPESESLGAAVEELVAAHRVMQLTADRAGLLLADSLSASLRAMLSVSPDYRPLLDRALHTNLDTALAERDGEGNLINQAVAIRTASLISFYLSDDYAILARELRR